MSQNFKVKHILDERIGQDGKSSFKIQWEEAWVPEDELQDYKDLIENYRKQDKVMIEVMASQRPSSNGDGSHVYVIRVLGSQTLNANCIAMDGLEGKALIDRLNEAAERNKPTAHVNGERHIKNIMEQYQLHSSLTPEVYQQSSSSLSPSIATMVQTKSHMYTNQVASLNEFMENELEEQKKGRSPRKRRSLNDLYYCSACGAGFVHQTHLKIHERTHTGEKPYKCETCGRCFAQKGNLRVHMKIHTGEKDYHCHACDRRFITNAQLVVHMRTHTNPNRKKSYANRKQSSIGGNEISNNLGQIIHVVPNYQEGSFRYIKDDSENWRNGSSPINSPITDSSKTFDSPQQQASVLTTGEQRDDELFSFPENQNEVLDTNEGGNVVHILPPTI